MKKTIVKVLLIAACIVVALAYAGKADYNEQVIYNMPDSEYHAIVNNLTAVNGKKPTENQIVKAYTSNKN